MKKLTITTIIFILAAAGFGFPAGVNISSPNSGTVWSAGSTGTILWECGAAKSMDMKINIFRNSISQANYVLQLKSKNTGRTVWSIPPGFQSGKYILRIKTGNNRMSGDSRVFSIKGKSSPQPPPPAPGAKSLAVTYPVGGETLSQNSETAITWSSKSLTTPLNIELWKGNRKYGTIATGVSAPAARQKWKVGHTFGNPPAGSGNDYRIRIAGDGLIAMSSRYFSITTLPSVSVNNINHLVNSIQTLQKPVQPMMTIAIPPEILEIKMWSKDPNNRGQVLWGESFDVKVLLKNTSKSVDQTNWDVAALLDNKNEQSQKMYNSNSPKSPGQTWWFTMTGILSSYLPNKSGFHILTVKIGKNKKSTMMGVLKVTRSVLPQINNFEIFDHDTFTWKNKGKYKKGDTVDIRYDVVNADKLIFKNLSSNKVIKTIQLPNPWASKSTNFKCEVSGFIEMTAVSNTNNFKTAKVYLDTTGPLQIGGNHLDFRMWRTGRTIKTSGMAQNYRSITLVEILNNGKEVSYKKINSSTAKSTRLDWEIGPLAFPVTMRLKVVFLDYSQQSRKETFK